METLHEALETIGLRSRPSNISGKREIYRKVDGKVVAVWGAAEAWKHVYPR